MTRAVSADPSTPHRCSAGLRNCRRWGTQDLCRDPDGAIVWASSDLRSWTSTARSTKKSGLSADCSVTGSSAPLPQLSTSSPGWETLVARPCRASMWSETVRVEGDQLARYRL